MIQSEYTIQELCLLSGISSRTLRYYDEIGLLKPSYINASGYRMYTDSEVTLLQQILFYRERGLKLEQIRQIVCDESFQPLTALTEHLAELSRQEERLRELICLVKRTIADMKGEITMTDMEKFEAFKKKHIAENEASYGSEIRKKYGDEAVDASNQKLLHMTQTQYQEFQALEQTILKELTEAVRANISPDSETGKHICELHKTWLTYTWKSYSAGAHKGLAAMYLADERFQSYYDREQEGCAAFLCDAIEKWAE